MATVIKKRTIFYDHTGGLMRFADYAVVTTALGTMVEPFTSIGLRAVGNTALQEFDWSDDMARIDEMQQISLDVLPRLLSSDSGSVLHGGTIMPRDGR